MRILGISAFYHDSAAALIEDGRIIAAAQEERFSRKKHDPRFPVQAIGYCLDHAGVDLDQVDHVVFYEKPFGKSQRLFETYLANSPRGFQFFKATFPDWFNNRLLLKSKLKRALRPFSRSGNIGDKLLFTEHHQSHGASAYFPSPYDEAVVLVIDGVGERATTSVSIGRGNSLEMIKEIKWPHSLGMLLSAFTQYTGFKVNSGEYKIMGLAPYGEPRYFDLIMSHLIDVKEDGSFWLDQRYFNYSTGSTMTSPMFHELFGGLPREPESLITQREMDLTASVQKVIEEIILRITRDLASTYNIANLCLAGSLALNCVANGQILRDGAFQNIWIQPAAGDAGGALGAALATYHQYLGAPRRIDPVTDQMAGSFLGPEYSQSEIEADLVAIGAKFEVLDNSHLLERTCDCLEAGHAVGWFQGRMEFGPRALGGRSILGDARNPEMQKLLNQKIKYRESFRPFAPSVLCEEVSNCFELDVSSPYMLLVAQVHPSLRRDTKEADNNLFGIEKLNVPRSQIPAVTHVDYSARVQTVHRDTNPRYHALLSAFNDRTGCPVLVNTSFNVRGEPIVCTAEDAFRCFMGTGMETLIIGNCLLAKSKQNPSLLEKYKDRYELD